MKITFAFNLILLLSAYTQAHSDFDPEESFKKNNNLRTEHTLEDLMFDLDLELENIASCPLASDGKLQPHIDWNMTSLRSVIRNCPARAIADPRGKTCPM
jgi:hypothetical protein